MGGKVALTGIVAGVKEYALCLSFPMSTSSAEHRQSAPPYAPLRAMGEAAGATTGAGASGNGSAKPAAETASWKQEADKLDVLLQALWGGFIEADANGLPTALADYVSAYTGAMRLRLTLMGYSAVPGRGLKLTSTVGIRTKHQP